MKKRKKIDDELRFTRQLSALRSDNAKLKAHVKRLTGMLDDEETLLEKALETKKSLAKHRIRQTSRKKSVSEATAVVLASDWHCEEFVDAKTVNHLNHYDLDIARACADEFFRRTLRMCNIFGREIKIDNLVLALLGDRQNCHLSPLIR